MSMRWKIASWVGVAEVLGMGEVDAPESLADAQIVQAIPAVRDRTLEPITHARRIQTCWNKKLITKKSDKQPCSRLFMNV